MFAIAPRKARKNPANLAVKLGKINRKAAQTLSETDAAIIYSATSMAYYAAKYWQTSSQDWKELREYIAVKVRKENNKD